MKFYIKNEKWDDFEQNHRKYGYNKRNDGNYWKHTGTRRVIFVYKFNKEVRDEKIDNTTYCGYAYEGEFRHRTKTYIPDLIKDGYIILKKD